MISVFMEKNDFFLKKRGNGKAIPLQAWTDP
jgi:hypothetical protein